MIKTLQKYSALSRLRFSFPRANHQQRCASMFMLALTFWFLVRQRM
jgi:hypothetical protein